MGRLKTLKERNEKLVAKKAVRAGEAVTQAQLLGGQGTHEGKLLEDRAASRRSFRTKKMGGL